MAEPGTVCSPVSQGKRRFLFALLPPAIQDAIELDTVAGFSVTDAVTARQITTILRRLPGRHTDICDGTACVGGNTISFALHGFERILAVENNETRIGMLRRNVDTVRRGTESSMGIVHCLQGSCVALALGGDNEASRAVRGASILFLDPPWGGSGYRTSGSKIELDLDGLPLAQLCALVAASGAAYEWIALKLPENYDFEALISAFDRTRVLILRHLRKMVLAVIDCRDADARAAHVVTRTTLAPVAYAVDEDRTTSASGTANLCERGSSSGSISATAHSSAGGRTAAKRERRRRRGAGGGGGGPRTTAPRPVMQGSSLAQLASSMSISNCADERRRVPPAEQNPRGRRDNRFSGVGQAYQPRGSEGSWRGAAVRSQGLNCGRPHSDFGSHGRGRHKEDRMRSAGASPPLQPPKSVPYRSEAASLEALSGHHLLVYLPGHVPRGVPYTKQFGFYFEAEDDLYALKHVNGVKADSTHMRRAAVEAPYFFVPLPMVEGERTAKSAFRRAPIEAERRLLMQIEAALVARAQQNTAATDSPHGQGSTMLSWHLGAEEPSLRDALDGLRIAFPPPPTPILTTNGCMALCGPAARMEALAASRDLGALHGTAPENGVLCFPVSLIDARATDAVLQSTISTWCLRALNGDGVTVVSWRGAGASSHESAAVEVAVASNLRSAVRRLVHFCDPDWSVMLSVQNYHDTCDDARTGGRGVHVVGLPGGRRHLGENALSVARRKMVEECGVGLTLLCPQGNTPDDAASFGQDDFASASADGDSSEEVDEPRGCLCRAQATLVDATPIHRSMTAHVVVLEESSDA